MNNPHDPAKLSKPVPRIGSGPDGRAVHLNTVAKWLAERDDLAPDDAYGRLLDTLARLEPGAVHWLANDSEGYGQPLPVRDEWFATSDGAPGFANGRRVISRGIGRHTPPPVPAPSLSRGAEGFASWLRWRTDLRPFLIVAESVARRLWGWGEVAVPVPDVLASMDGLKARLEGRRKGAPWQGDEVAFLRAEFQRLGGWRTGDGGKTWSKVTSVQTELAKKLGRKRPALDRHLEGGPDRGAAAFQAVSGVLSGTR